MEVMLYQDSDPVVNIIEEKPEGNKAAVDPASIDSKPKQWFIK